ncbi:hypothetical protein M0R45_014821 [Rubus argutus]|uniref:Uncharacterized protein n=1 Tax=Rubus argutus TaxID=59490 RepID=A0AAW1XNN6_RUBAR
MEKLRKGVKEVAYTEHHSKLSHLQLSLIPVLFFASSLCKVALSLSAAPSTISASQESTVEKLQWWSSLLAIWLIQGFHLSFVQGVMLVGMNPNCLIGIFLEGP